MPNRPNDWSKDIYYGHPAEIVRVLGWMSTEPIPPRGYTLAQLRDHLGVSDGVIRGMTVRGYLSREEHAHRYATGSQTDRLGYYRVTDYGTKALAEVRATERAVAARKAQEEGKLPGDPSSFDNSFDGEPDAEAVRVAIRTNVKHLCGTIDGVLNDVYDLLKRVEKLRRDAQAVLG